MTELRIKPGKRSGPAGVFRREEWTCLIPAAGRGSRLDFDKPKILFPVSGKTILHHLIDRFEPYCIRFVVVASREGAEQIRAGFADLAKDIDFEIVIQPEPIGMADAIRRGETAVETEFTALVWGDQICLRDETLSAVLDYQSSHPNAVLTFPTARKREPYTHVVRGPDGEIEKILQAREGEIECDEGENDCGFFAFRSRMVFDYLRDNCNAEGSIGSATGEQNFLQLIPGLRRSGMMVDALCIATAEETLGVNTPVDAENAETILRRRTQNAGDGRLRIAMFSGGRGTANLANAFVAHPKIDLYLLVNAYDDGLSTGRLRNYVPGFLGPSDFRKNVARLIPSDGPSNRALKYILEYRLPDPMDADAAVNILRNLYKIRSPLLEDRFWEELDRVSVGKSRYIEKYIGRFLDFHDAQGNSAAPFDFSDCSLGNIILAGVFLECDSNFNRAIAHFQKEMSPAASVLNVTEGEPFVLVALKRDGTIRTSEAEIVGPQDANLIEDIYLLESYLSDEELAELNRLDHRKKAESLGRRAATPKISHETEQILKTADLIIFGPGTQHSSLFPTYLTSGVGEAIASNERAEKIFIGNIRKDNEIQAETINSLVEKFMYYMTRKGSIPSRPEDFVTRYFFQDVGGAPLETARSETYLSFSPDEFNYPSNQSLIVDWEAGSGEHSGGRVLEELLSIVNEKSKLGLKSPSYMASIVVPVLNEARTLDKVLSELNLLNLQPYGLLKEIIVVDGGSTDGSPEIAQSKDYVRYLGREDAEGGRGAAIRRGMALAKGDIVVTFPSDNEYEASELVELIRTCSQTEFKAVFGSRAIKCLDLSGQLKTIYRGRRLPYLVSKFGGMLLSILCLVLYNRFISDPLTGVKVFDRRLINSLGLRSNGVDLEAEIIAKLSKSQVYILEMPIRYSPRLKTEGKKITIWDGVNTLFRLFFFKFSAR